MRTLQEWRDYVRGRAEHCCRLCGLLSDDQPLAAIQPPGLATMLGALCSDLTHRASVSQQPQPEVEQGIERVLWNRIRHDREAA